MLEFIGNLPGWVKLTGASGMGILILAVVLLEVYIQDQDAIEAPGIIKEARKNATMELINATNYAAAESSETIISAFHKEGKNLAQDVDDPVAKIGIETSMTLAGVALAAFIVISLFSALFAAIKR